jgi:predicted pyridoxine 5'-phosphate oxidase superfamily flavin-nucleotide-binding protein
VAKDTTSVIMPAIIPVSEESHPDEIMFSSSVRAEQVRQGSREAYQRRASNGGFAAELSDAAIAFIRARESAYLATASADGQPYIQHRGGPPGFISVLDRKTVAFAEYPGNRQFVTSGHLAINERAFLFLMDYANARRLKLWGTAKLTEEPALLGDLACASEVIVESAIVFTVRAADWNCSKYIPKLVAMAAKT